jgi:NAD(P)H-dependent FMN reductase
MALVEALMGDPDIVRVLAISGSLRKTSSNSALVSAAVLVAPVGVEVSTYGELADIPPFNPDLDTDAAPIGVVRFRAALEACDAILICSPEYAHGVSGVLKNALDWVVGSGELINKPIALINASMRATHAYASLKETLTTMSGRVIEEASVTIPLDGSRCDASGIAGDVQLSGVLTASLAALAGAAGSPEASVRAIPDDGKTCLAAGGP